MSWKRWILAATLVAAPAAVWAATHTPKASTDCPCKPGEPCPLKGGQPCALEAAPPAGSPCPCAGGANATASQT